MAKRKYKKEIVKSSGSLFDDLSPQAKQAIGAVVVAVVGMFFIASLFDFGGLVGGYAEKILRWLFGTGAYLAPLICFFYVFVLLNPKENEEVSISKVIGVAILFVSVLGVLELYQADLGGMFGFTLLYPLKYLLGKTLAGIFLFGFILISVFLIFNIGLHLPHLFRTKEASEDDDLKNLTIPPEINEPVTDNTIQTDNEKDARELGKQNLLKVVSDKFMPHSPDFVVSTFNGSYDSPPLSLLKRDVGKPQTGDVKGHRPVM